MSCSVGVPLSATTSTLLSVEAEAPLELGFAASTVEQVYRQGKHPHSDQCSPERLWWMPCGGLCSRTLKLELGILDEGGGDHEKDQQNKDHVNEWRDIQIAALRLTVSKTPHEASDSR